MDPLILKYAGWIIMTVLGMTVTGFLMNAAEQISKGGYVMPAQYFDMFMKILLAGVSCLWVSKKVSERKNGEDK